MFEMSLSDQQAIRCVAIDGHGAGAGAGAATRARAAVRAGAGTEVPACAAPRATERGAGPRQRADVRHASHPRVLGHGRPRRRQAWAVLLPGQADRQVAAPRGPRGVGPAYHARPRPGPAAAAWHGHPAVRD